MNIFVMHWIPFYMYVGCCYVLYSAQVHWNLDSRANYKYWTVWSDFKIVGFFFLQIVWPLQRSKQNVLHIFASSFSFSCKGTFEHSKCTTQIFEVKLWLPLAGNRLKNSKVKTPNEFDNNNNNNNITIITSIESIFEMFWLNDFVAQL